MPAPNLRLLLGAAFLCALAACGGGSDSFPPAPVTGPVVLPAVPNCRGPADYTLMVYWNAPPSETPRAVQASVTCLGTPVAGVAVDWGVTAGRGTLDDEAGLRTFTDASGHTTVAWKYGRPGTQTIEAQLTEPALQRFGTLTYTVLPVGANACAAGGGTHLGESRTVSADETWTRAGSPYYTQCAASICTGQLAVSGNAVLTLEPGVAVCVNQVLVAGGARLAATGTSADPVTFGVRDRGEHWKGLEFQRTDEPTLPRRSVLRHVAVENADSVRVSAHPIDIEDTLVRRVAPGNRLERCTSFEIRQHTVASIAPSSISRTVIDNLGQGPTPWEYGDASCPAVRINLMQDSPPLTMSARIVNSRSIGAEIVVHSNASNVHQTLLTNCEISGSESSGLAVYGDIRSMPRIESCNVFGNAGYGVDTEHHSGPSGPIRLPAQRNWWGDPAGPQGPMGDGSGSYVDASLHLSEPVSLEY